MKFSGIFTRGTRSPDRETPGPYGRGPVGQFYGHPLQKRINVNKDYLKQTLGIAFKIFQKGIITGEGS